MRTPTIAWAALAAGGACIATCALPAIADDATAQRATQQAFTWHRLADLPDAHGFAGAYVGVSNGALIVAGGANFPDAPPWRGGTKTWYDAAFVMPAGAHLWQRIDHALPSVRGYGASITTRDGLLCIGGSDATRHYADVFTLTWAGDRIVKHDLPSLPTPMANFTAAAIGSTVYIAGGIDAPTATRALHRFLSIDLAQADPKWQELEPWPGEGRMLAVAAIADGAFYLVSGTSLTADAAGKPARTYLRDAYRYVPNSGWQRIADVPHAVVAAPSPAESLGGHGFAIFGGDDGVNVNFEPKDQHPGFNRDLLAYDVATNTWRVAGQLPLGQVTTSLTILNGDIVMPSGEIRPGVRTPQVNVATPTTEPSR